MRGRFSFILLVIFGSFCVYCAQNVVGDNNGNGGGGNGSGGGGMVGSAGADTCCTPPDPPAGTVLFDKTFTVTNDNSECVSPTIDVAGNRTIVVHGAIPTNGSVAIQWTFGGAAGWVYQSITTTSAVVVLDGRLGKQVRVYYGSPYATSSPCGTQQSLTVVGYKQ